jgi:hypothetical protein
MADFIRRSFDAPDGSTRFPGARVDVVTVRPGNIGSIPPGHDAWVVANDTVVGFDFLAGTIDRRVVD